MKCGHFPWQQIPKQNVHIGHCVHSRVYSQDKSSNAVATNDSNISGLRDNRSLFLIHKTCPPWIWWEGGWERGLLLHVPQGPRMKEMPPSHVSGHHARGEKGHLQSLVSTMTCPSPFTFIYSSEARTSHKKSQWMEEQNSTAETSTFPLSEEHSHTQCHVARPFAFHYLLPWCNLWPSQSKHIYLPIPPLCLCKATQLSDSAPDCSLLRQVSA